MSALNNPKPGDIVSANVHGKTVKRTVLGNDYGDIRYKVEGKLFTKKCWVTTWAAWCRKNNAVEVSQ